MEEAEVQSEEYKPHPGDPPLEMYSDDNAGAMPESEQQEENGGDADFANGSPEQLDRAHQDSVVLEQGSPEMANGEAKCSKRRPCSYGNGNGKALVSRASSATSSFFARSDSSTSTTRPFLKSSSPAAIARRQQQGGASVSNGSLSAPTTPRAATSSSSSRLSATPSKTTGVKRGMAESPVTPSRPSFDNSRRASLSSLTSRSVPSAAELRRWANSKSPAKSRLHSPAQSSASKNTDMLRRSSSSGVKSTSTTAPKSPGSTLKTSSKLGTPTSKQSSSATSRLAGSPASVQKKSSPVSATSRRSFESPTISSRSMASERTPSSEKTQNMLARRKSLTPEPRDTRLITLPPVDTKAGDDVRLDLRGQKLRTLDCNLVHLTPKLEFVYLRDNKLSSMNGIEILKRVKVLDLSFNEFKGGGFEPLGNCKALQQLYLAGNQITSLSGLPQLPNLEFLSVAQNRLKSLAMATQPRLQVLAASKNKISTLKGFPYLPALEHLRLEENPILEVPHLEAAAILLVGPTLKKFNDRDLSPEEQEVALLYPASTALCVRDGWEFSGPEEAAESTTQFLMDQWKDNMPPGFTLLKAFIERPFEEDPCHCEFVFQALEGEQRELDLKYQWFIGDRTPSNFVPIDGASNKVYWPKHEDVGCCLKVDCTAALDGTVFPPVSAFSFQVSPGTGCPKVLSIQIEGEPIEGELIRGSAEVAWCGGTPGSGVVSWLRRIGSSSPLTILGAEDFEYKLVLEDVGAQLLFMYTPVTEEGVKGESHCAATSIIEAASPSVNNVHIKGESVEGNTIFGTGEYFGGREGTSKFEWLREEPESGEFKVVAKGSSEYLLTEDDVGLTLTFVYTPANSLGQFGEAKSASTGKVLLAPPRILQLRLVGEMREGSKVVVSGIFIGGVEGASRVQWFKTSSPSPEDFSASKPEPISTLKIAKAFRIPLGAVGYYLAAQYTPVRADGESGEPAIAISDVRVEMLPPSLNFLSITGEFVEGEILTASYGYIGGYEGASQYNWYLHESTEDPGVLVSEAAGSLQYHITEEAVDKFVSFHCTPIRDDGVAGEKMISMSQERISPGFPKLLKFQITGEAVEGNDLYVEKLYWGGKEGASRLQWFLTTPDGSQRDIRGATCPSYTVRLDDVNGLLCCSCEPVRDDGERGAVRVSQLVGPVVPALPTCKSLTIRGKAVEGEILYASAAYSGGQKGPCEFEWWRRGPSGEQKYLGNAEFLELKLEDVGSCIKLVFIPVRSDGFVGDAYSATSDVVVEGHPEGIELALSDCIEDVEVVPYKQYFGGREGESYYMWYRAASRPRDDANLPIDAEFISSSVTYTPSLQDVGAYLLLEWVPTREDGKRGSPLVACSRRPVAAAPPTVHNVSFKEVSPHMFVGDALYHGGKEGASQLSWYRESADGSTTLIEGASSRTYIACEDDYTCRIIFGYTPVRDDGVVGDLVVSEPSDVIYPELPRVQKFVLSGKVIEGEVLTALEVMPKGETQQRVWERYKKEIKYQWSRSTESGGTESFELLPEQRACTYKVRLEDVGYCLRCECIIYDVFGRSTEPVWSVTQPVVPAFPRVEKLEIEGRGYHTNLYSVRGTYVGGREGRSTIQWFRAMAGSPDLIPISGETGRMYEANVDDVGYRLVAVYTPVREDGVEGNPTSASTDPIEVEPEVAKEVKQKLELGAIKFEVLRDRDRSPTKGQQQQQALGSLERRVLDVNRKRVKVIRPGTKTSFASTQIRGTYSPPFHVEVFRNDPHRLKIVIDSENEVDLMVRTRHIRDVTALVIRGLAQRYNSTPLNLLLKM